MKMTVYLPLTVYLLREVRGLAKSIIEQRIKRNMTQEEVARKAGMPQSAVSRIEDITHGLPRQSGTAKIL
jgi:transcriptional regulator with XRE-family HTH domain